MNINRHNYEEFFILYMDNELSSEDRGRVELFARQHPDLGEELAMLQQTRLSPDESVVFKGKHGLMKSAAFDFITMENYQEWLLLYVDNELTNEQKTAVEVFATTNPSILNELGLLQKTKLQPETIVFADKESLYRKEEKAPRVIVLRWWSVAAAILLILGLTIGGFLIFRNTGNIEKNGIAVKNPEPVKIKVVSPPNQSQSTNTPDETSLPVTNPDQENIAVTTTQVKKNRNSREMKQAEKENDVLLALIDEEKNRNNLPNASRNPNMNGKNESDNKLIAFNSPSKEALTSQEALTNQPEINIPLPVTPETDPTLQFVADGKKTKFRGILRKITRTFEKTTNIKATDDDDRLLVAGLAIKL